MSKQYGRLIVINGASSAGKSTLAAAAQAALPSPFLCLSPDFILFSGALPRDADGELRDWPSLRPRIFEGYFGALRAFVEAGVDVIADFIIEDEASLRGLESAVDRLDVFWVGLHVELEELERRERDRGDRREGDARRDLETVHSFRSYDLDLQAADGLDANVNALVDAWEMRQT